MPSDVDRPAETPILVCLHALGASRASFADLAQRLGSGLEVVALDLPGYGDEPASSGTTVAEMVAFVEARIRAHLDRRGWPRWLLVGHSMGGKIATIVAARTLAGEARLFGLSGVVLLAGSPPGPEPMVEEQREQMLGWASDGPVTWDQAEEFVAANVGSPLAPDAVQQICGDLTHADPEAWRAWLLRGSREDWTADVGVIDLPALIIGGTEDDDLGAASQPSLHGDVYPRARFLTAEGAGHHLLWERPADVATAVAELWTTIAGGGPRVPASAAAAIASRRTSTRTRGILARRAVADDPAYTPRALSAQAFSTLRTVAATVVPQDGPSTAGRIDLAARVDAQLAAGTGNGWRFADLPPDVEAYELGLGALLAIGALDPDGQEALLRRAAEGELGDTVQRWFEDACDDLVRAWLAHPATLAAIGFDGYANGGDGPRLQGFTLLDAGEREAWEPVAEDEVEAS